VSPPLAPAHSCKCGAGPPRRLGPQFRTKEHPKASQLGMRCIAARRRIVVALSTVSALVLIGAGGGPAAPAQRSTRSLGIPVVDQAVTPSGWLPVDVGDVQLSVPSSWGVLTSASAGCGSQAGVVVIGGQWCPPS
jgi:hypothetical protein